MGTSSENDNNNNQSKPVNDNAGFEKVKVLCISDKRFLIKTNEGRGDCLFRAISQAVFGEEFHHFGIRFEIVKFIVENWDRFKALCIQLPKKIEGNAANYGSAETYAANMSDLGTYGSMLELQAAGEIFQQNFTCIQEYKISNQKTYRVENSHIFEDVPLHYLLFTGHYDNGHWEYLQEISSGGDQLSDGKYQGVCKTFIAEIEETTNIPDIDNQLERKHSLPLLAPCLQSCSKVDLQTLVVDIFSSYRLAFQNNVPVPIPKSSSSETDPEISSTKNRPTISRKRKFLDSESISKRAKSKK